MGLVYRVRKQLIVRMLVLVASIIILLSDPSTETVNAATFNDTGGHWAFQAITRAAAVGFINGYPGDLFKPERPVNRAEFLKMLLAAIKLVPLRNALPFNDSRDIPSWAVPYVAGGVEAGIITGYEDNTFHPWQPLTRAEMAVIFERTVKLLKGDGFISSLKGAELSIAHLVDARIIPDWAGLQ